MFGADLPYNMYIQEEESKVNDGWNFDLEDYLAPHSQVPHPWNRQPAGETHLDVDFILVAEFSELEGPREVVSVKPIVFIVTLLLENLHYLQLSINNFIKSLANKDRTMGS